MVEFPAFLDELDSFPFESDDFDFIETTEVPFLGVVAAGAPYTAFAVEESLAVPTTLWGRRQVFALRVRGNSMVDEGIHDGDFLIVQPSETAQNGQTVVAEVDGAVTVKKLFREKDGKVRLQPANPEMLPLFVSGEDFRVIGAVVGVLRKFGFSGGAAPRQQKDAPAAPSKRSDRRPEEPLPIDDAISAEITLNAIDDQLARWDEALARAERDGRKQTRVAHMAELSRDLHSLREWFARTQRPTLRRALLAEAHGIMRRMKRFGGVAEEPISPTLH